MKILQSNLEAKLARLNSIAGFENPEYSTVGAYCLDYAYGGVSLERYTNKHGNVKDIFNVGHVTKKELYNLMTAYECGINVS